MHFTYADSPDSANLHQGDVLRRTPAVVELLRTIHPHYHDKQDYRFFAVLTQSCDLIRRGGRDCSSRYITIAAVRPARVAVGRELARVQYEEVERVIGFCATERKGKLKQFAERLLNNNEENYFYLRAEPGVGLDEDHCVFLQLSVALKASVHYESLLEAKVLQLAESFEHKLGYLVGSSYSRVGTSDWVPEHVDQAAFDQLVEDHVDSTPDTIWLDKKRHAQVLGRLKKLPREEWTLEVFQAVLGEIQANASTRRRDLLQLIERTAHEAGADERAVNTTILRLQNSADFKLLTTG